MVGVAVGSGVGDSVTAPGVGASVAEGSGEGSPVTAGSAAGVAVASGVGVDSFPAGLLYGLRISGSSSVQPARRAVVSRRTRKRAILRLHFTNVFMDNHSFPDYSLRMTPVSRLYLRYG